MNKKKNKIDIFSIVNEINSYTENHMKEINWEKNAVDIVRTIKISKFRKNKNHNKYFTFSLKFVIPSVIIILMIGISIGLFISYNDDITKSNSPQPHYQETRITLAKLESTLNKREINTYFDQANLLLTEIMEESENRTITTDIKYINSRRIRGLLRKNRFFNKNSYDAKWLVSNSLLKKIEWVLIEILMSDGKLDYNKLKQLQKYIIDEKLLFKVKLLSSEASFSEV